MFERIMNLDCELIALGTKLFTAKEKVLAEARYGAAVVSDKMDKTTGDLKAKTEKTKVKMKENKAKREAERKAKKLETKKAKEAEKKTESKETKKEVVKETKYVSKEPVKTVATIKPAKDKAETVEAEIVEDKSLMRGVTYAPDFSGLENVAIPLESEITETIEDPVVIKGTKKPKDGKEVTQEDLDKALKKIKNNMIKE